MGDQLNHLRNMKRRFTESNKGNPKENMSAEEKVDLLEKSLNLFRTEVNMKLKLLQEVLTTRNEQAKAQKEFFSREQALYSKLLKQWMQTSNASKTGFTVNSIEADLVLGDCVTGMDESYQDYSENDEVEIEKAISKKSKSFLRKKRNSSKNTPKKRKCGNVGVSMRNAEELGDHSEYDAASVLYPTTVYSDDIEATCDSDEVEMKLVTTDAVDEDFNVGIDNSVGVQDFDGSNNYADGDFMNQTQALESGVTEFATPDCNPTCRNTSGGKACGVELSLSQRKNRKGLFKPCYRCPRCRTYSALSKWTNVLAFPAGGTKEYDTI